MQKTAQNRIFARSALVLMFALWLILGTSRGFALDIPPAPENFIYDSAHLLSSEGTQRLSMLLRDFEAKTSNQLSVATFPSLEGEALEDFTIRVFDAWKPGQKERDNGVILFIFKNDRKLRIEVGYGLEATLTDALSKRIIETEIVPYFKQGDFENGILAGTSAIFQATTGSYTALPPKSSSKSTLRLGAPSLVLLWIVISIFFRRFSPNTGIGTRRHAQSWGGFGGGGFGGGGFGGGGFGGGSGGGGGSSGRW